MTYGHLTETSLAVALLFIALRVILRLPKRHAESAPLLTATAPHAAVTAAAASAVAVDWPCLCCVSTGSGSKLDLDERLYAPTFRLQQWTFRLRGSALDGRRGRGCKARPCHARNAETILNVLNVCCRARCLLRLLCCVRGVVYCRLARVVNCVESVMPLPCLSTALFRGASGKSCRVFFVRRLHYVSQESPHVVHDVGLRIWQWQYVTLHAVSKV